VTRRLLDEPGIAPQVGVHRVLDDERPLRLEGGPDLRGQALDGTLGDETVRVEAPGVGGDGRDRHEEREEAGRDAMAHLVIL